MSKKASIAKNYIYNLIYNVFNVIAPLLIAPYISRVIGVDGIGIKSYTLSIVSNFIIIASLGTATYAQREIAICRENSYEYSKKTIEIGLLRFITTFIVGLVYTVCFVLPIFNKSYNYIYAILLINILSNMLDFSWFFQGMEEFKKISIVQLISKILFIVSTFLFVNTEKDLNIFIFLNSLVLLINSIIPFLFIFKYLERVKLRELEIKKHIKASIVYFIPTIAVQIYTVLDKTMIGAITNSASENGYYEQADKLLKIALSIVTSMNIIMRSRISYLYAKDDIDTIKSLISKSLDLLTFFVYPIIIGIISVADWFVPMFFGSGYDKVIPLIYILAPIILIIGISNLIGTHYYTPSGRQSLSNKFLICGSIVNLFMNFILIKPLGSIGAAISSILSELTITILYLHFGKEIINLIDIFRKSLKNIFASILMGILVIILKKLMEFSVINLGIIIFCGVIIYSIILVILKDEFLIYIFGKLKNKFLHKKGINNE